MTIETVSEAVPDVAVVNPLIVAPKTQTGAAQLWQPWTLIIPALLVLPLLGLAISWQISPTTDDILMQKPHRHVQAEPTPRKTTTLMALFVPGDDEQLHRRTVTGHGIKMTEMPTDVDMRNRMQGILALNQLFAAAPKYFPPGTQLEDFTLEQTENGTAIAHVSLNATFWNSDYWAMDSRPYLVIQAIANTLAEIYQPYPPDFQLLLLRDGQNPSVLGQYDIADPIALDENIVGDPSPAPTATPAPPSVTWPAPAKPTATVAAP